MFLNFFLIQYIGLASSPKKAKAVPLHAMKALGGGEEHSSYSYSTSALDGGEWSASRPGRALAPEKGPLVPIVQEAGWAPEAVWTQRLEEKSFAPTLVLETADDFRSTSSGLHVRS
jgi:hypothetical protein